MGCVDMLRLKQPIRGFGYVGDKETFKSERKLVVQSIYHKLIPSEVLGEKRDEAAIEKLFPHAQNLAPVIPEDDEVRAVHLVVTV
jgi:hypothetical protein